MQIGSIQSVNMDSIVKRVHDAAALGPKRTIVNYPLKDFGDRWAPLSVGDWEVFGGDIAYQNFDSALEAARLYVTESDTGKFLLSSNVFERHEWPAYKPAKERVVSRHAAQAIAHTASTPLAALTWFGDIKRSYIESGIVTCTKGVDGSLVVWTMGTSLTMLTPDIEEQSKKCAAAGKIVMISVYLDLVFKDTRRFHSGNVIKPVKFAHFAPSITMAMAELRDLVRDIQLTHTGDTDYPEYKH
jgi:hypothetical protein